MICLVAAFFVSTHAADWRVCMAAACPSVRAPNCQPPHSYRIETIAGNGDPGDFVAAGHATKVPVDLPFGVELGPGGDLFISTVGTHRVLRWNRETGQLRSVVGNGRRGYSGDGRPATDATLNEPYEVRFDSGGNMFIVEMQNHLVRRVDAQTNTITTVAGDGFAGDRGDGGPARAARFHDPHSIALDEHDNIYVSDLANHRVRRIDAKSGRIDTIVGNGKRGLPVDGGVATEQPFLTPQGLAIRENNIWIASVSGQSIWRVDRTDGRIHRVAGTGRQGRTGDGGDPLEATFDGPRGMTLTAPGLLYLSDGENNIIRAIDTLHGTIRTIAGVGRDQHSFGGDGIPATIAPLWQPHGVLVLDDGSIVFSDTRNHRVRRLVPGGAPGE